MHLPIIPFELELVRSVAVALHINVTAADNASRKRRNARPNAAAVLCLRRLTPKKFIAEIARELGEDFAWPNAGLETDASFT